MRKSFGVQVHPRSIERQLSAQKKTALNPSPRIASPRAAQRRIDRALRGAAAAGRSGGRWVTRRHGLALFMRSGMSAWMQAWSPVPVAAPHAAGSNRRMTERCFPVQLHREVAMLLASMVLFARQEAIA